MEEEDINPLQPSEEQEYWHQRMLLKDILNNRYALELTEEEISQLPEQEQEGIRALQRIEQIRNHFKEKTTEKGDKPKVLPEPLDVQEKKTSTPITRNIDKMESPENKEETYGSISPSIYLDPYSDTLIITEQNTPTLFGFRKIDTGNKEHIYQAKLFNRIEAQKPKYNPRALKKLDPIKSHIVQIDNFNPETSFIPIPEGYYMESASLNGKPTKVKLLKNTTSKAIIEPKEKGTLMYAITRKTPASMSFSQTFGNQVKSSIYLPKKLVQTSQEEAELFRQTFRLPKDWHEYIEKYPEIKADLICMYVAENYVYGMHPDLGRMLDENKEDLPSIVQNLRVGHCDYLSWITACFLKAYGVEDAYVESGSYTNKHGNSFKVIGHSRVRIGERIFDPSTECNRITNQDSDKLSGIDTLYRNTSPSQREDFLNSMREEVHKWSYENSPNTIIFQEKYIIRDFSALDDLRNIDDPERQVELFEAAMDLASSPLNKVSRRMVQEVFAKTPNNYQKIIEMTPFPSGKPPNKVKTNKGKVAKSLTTPRQLYQGGRRFNLETKQQVEINKRYERIFNKALRSQEKTYAGEIEDYNPEKHRLEDISAMLSARHGKAMARKRSNEKTKQDTLQIHFDDFNEFTMDKDTFIYLQLLSLLTAIKAYQKRHPRIKIYLSINNIPEIIDLNQSFDPKDLSAKIISKKNPNKFSSGSSMSLMRRPKPAPKTREIQLLQQNCPIISLSMSAKGQKGIDQAFRRSSRKSTVTNFSKEKLLPQIKISDEFVEAA